MLKSEQLQKISAGDMLVLRDVHTMEATGQAEWSTRVTAARRWHCMDGRLRYTIAEVQYQDARLAVVAKEVEAAPGTAKLDLVMYRAWTESAADTLHESVIGLWAPSDHGISFSERMRIQMDGEMVAYARLEHFPFNEAVDPSHQTVAPITLCEFRAPDVDPSSWCRNAFIEYWPKGRLTTVWLGWDLNPRDVDLLDS